MMTMESFSVSDAIIATGVTKPLLQSWLKHGWATNAISSREVEEKEIRFSREDLYHLGFLKKAVEAGISLSIAVEKINIYSLCQTLASYPQIEVVGIAFSRILSDGEIQTEGGWIISPELDRQTGWESLGLIEKRLRANAEDFYIFNFIQMKNRVDEIINMLQA
ncbi:MAG: hypothetical protein GY697_13090 [Desulfobacterales bacterium]|nr:hypothetical protein [Desulfobacterales bacterium]